MDYNISLSEDGTFLWIRVFETINGKMEKEFAGKAIEDARQHKINSFLVDVRGIENVASTLEQYMFGYEDVKKFGLNKNSKIAILVDEGDKSHDFIETVFMNAGYHCCLFRDEDAAIKWFGE